MIYCGMDVSSKSFTIHALDGRKKVIFKDDIEASKKGLKVLEAKLGRGPKTIVFEAGNQLKWIHDALKKMPATTVHVVHPNEIKWIAECSKKTDQVDAKKLAELARADMLPRPVKVVEGKARAMREFVSARMMLQSKRVALINSIRGLCKQEGVKLPEKFFNGDGWQAALKKTKMSKTLSTIVESFMRSIEALLESEAEITGELCAINDERVELVETIPAIGKITARVIVSAIDDADRFDDKKAVAKYGALTPTIYQSGDVKHLGRINRDGRQEVRRVLLQCAHTITRMKKNADARPLLEFYERIAKRAGKKRAVVALARKLLTTAYGVLKSGFAYDAKILTGKAA